MIRDILATFVFMFEMASALDGLNPSSPGCSAVMSRTSGTSDDRHSYGQLSRFLDDRALAACDSVEAAPPQPLLPRVAHLSARVDADLDLLWSD